MAVRDTDRRTDPEEHLQDDIDDHLAEVPDGCGCVEVWEHLSEGRG
jgi:hypothetical protein